jgi:ABC-type amino acid transport system permease subunit
MDRPPGDRADFPWWLLAAGLLGLAALAAILASPVHAQVLATVRKGMGITAFVSVVAFALSAALGLLFALGLSSRHIAVRQAARLVVEVLRGIPVIVLLLYIAFAGTPILVAAINLLAVPLGAEPWQVRDIPMIWRAIAALMVAYAPYIAEVFRAGFEAVDSGQVEAAKALGLRPGQRFRHIVFPQAIRIMAPPLGNFFIALVKDSALVSVLGVADVTQLGKLAASGNFRYLETYNVVTFVYLCLTIGLSVALRAVERRLNARTARDGVLPKPGTIL